MQRNRNAFALLWHFAYGLLIVFGKSRTIVTVQVLLSTTQRFFVMTQVQLMFLAGKCHANY